MVTDAFAGEYQSVFKGKGMEFEEVREYQPGDDIRSIDWNVTARMGHPYSKKFVEERELTVMLLLDVSPSCIFGTVKQLKSQLAAELCSVLALSAIKNKDKVGLIAFTDKIEKFIPPRKGLRHVLRVIREVLSFSSSLSKDSSFRRNIIGKGTDISDVLQYLDRVTTRRTITFIISDFYDIDFKKAISIANKRHDVVAVTITDPRESELPNVGIVKLDDAETNKSFLIDTSDESVRKSYNINSLKRFRERDELFYSTKVDHIDVRTDAPYYENLLRFFKTRQRKRSKG